MLKPVVHPLEALRIHHPNRPSPSVHLPTRQLVVVVLESLGLKQAVEVLDNTLDVAASKQLTYPEMLEQLLGAEVEARRERYLSTRTKMAHFPFQRTLEQFDFSFQPSNRRAAG